MLKISLLYSRIQAPDSPPLPIMILLAFLDVDYSVQIDGGKLNIREEIFFNKFITNHYKFLKDVPLHCSLLH